MTKKKWALIVLVMLLLLGWLKLFYKTHTENTVAKSADCIIVLDVKRITNTLIWNFITTPGQWKNSSVFSSSKNEVGWDDMVKIPDYVFVFHAHNHPANAWYAVFQIKDKTDFNKGLQQYHFEKVATLNNQQQYFSKEQGIEIIQSGDNLLLGNNAVEDKTYINGIATELFVKKQYTAKEQLKKNVAANSHLTIQILKNNFLQEGAVITANFDKTKIVIDALLTPQKQFSFAENNFSYTSSSLCALGFTQPPTPVYDLFFDSAKTGISRVVNFNIDSLLLQSNTNYQLDIAAIQPRSDSAITYSYDDNFNPVEKVVVNNVLEPAFNFIVKGNVVANIYNYWSSSGKIEQTAAGNLFVPMPFVKSYCSKNNEQELTITSNNYHLQQTDSTVNCILFLNILLTKIPAPLLNYLPVDVMKAITNIESIKVLAKKNNGQIIVHCSFNKKKNDLPIIEW